MSEIDEFGVQQMGLPPEVAAYVAANADALLRGLVRDAIGNAVRVTEGGVEVNWQRVLESLYAAREQPEPLYEGEDDGPGMPPYGVRFPIVRTLGIPVFRSYPMSARNAAAVDRNSSA